jgi:hypothetical protein
MDGNYRIGMAQKMSDFRGIPTPMCPCGSDLLRITATFDSETYEITGYLIDDANCAGCGALLTAPTPLDVAPLT